MSKFRDDEYGPVVSGPKRYSSKKAIQDALDEELETTSLSLCQGGEYDEYCGSNCGCFGLDDSHW